MFKSEVVNAPKDKDGFQGGIWWYANESNDSLVAGREKAVRGAFRGTRTARRFTVEEYDQWVSEKAALDKLVTTYKARIQSLKDKIEALKAEIAKG